MLDQSYIWEGNIARHRAENLRVQHKIDSGHNLWRRYALTSSFRDPFRISTWLESIDAYGVLRSSVFIIQYAGCTGLGWSAIEVISENLGGPNLHLHSTHTVLAADVMSFYGTVHRSALSNLG